MEKQFTCDRGTTIVTYHETEETKQQVFDAIIQWCTKHGAWAGEMISQDDDCQIYASVLISDIVDNILQFKANDNE